MSQETDPEFDITVYELHELRIRWYTRRKKNPPLLTVPLRKGTQHSRQAAVLKFVRAHVVSKRPVKWGTAWNLDASKMFILAYILDTATPRVLKQYVEGTISEEAMLTMADLQK